MKILVITGTPGTGKTTLAKKVAKLTNSKLIEEKKFVKENKLFTEILGDKSLVVDIKALEKKINSKIKKINSVVIEGHLFCETKIKGAKVVVLRTDSKILEKRLRKRKYNEIKIYDNIFVEESNYCLTKAKKTFGSKNLLEIDTSKKDKKTIEKIINFMVKK